MTSPCSLVVGFLCFFVVFLTTSGMKIAPAEEGRPPVFPETESNSTAGLFSFSENFKKITDSVKVLYSSAFSSNTTTDKSNTVLGTKCNDNNQCESVQSAICEKEMCICDNNHTISKQEVDKCVPVVNLGGDCTEEVQCEKGEPGSVCIDYKCMCSSHHSENDGKCIPRIKIGSACQGNVDCKPIPFSECIDKVCSCPDPLLPSQHLNVCLSVASPGERPPCQEDIQCTTQYGDKSRCNNNVCECDHSFHASNGKCIPDLKLGDSCNKTLDCMVSRYTEEGNIRECFNSTCTCAVGYKSTNEENFCVKAGEGYQLHASLAWLFCIFVVPYLF